MQTMSKVCDSSVSNDFRADEGSDSSDVENNMSHAMDYRLDSSLSLSMPMPVAGVSHNFLGVKQESDDSDSGEGLSPIPRNNSKLDCPEDLEKNQYDRKGEKLTYLFISLCGVA